MNKQDLIHTVDDAHPELPAGLHLPRFAVVTEIPDPPTEGETSHHTAPKYAVSCRLLTPQLQIDPDMPELRDVPVCLHAAGAARAIAALPQPGTVVEIAFGYGQLHLPFIRSALPYERPLPELATGDTMRWQHSAATWQQADAAGWQRQTDGAIKDEASASISITAPKVWLGSDGLNVLQAVSDHLQTIADALASLAGHIHPGVGASPSAADWSTASATTLALKAELDEITKPAP